MDRQLVCGVFTDQCHFPFIPAACTECRPNTSLIKIMCGSTVSYVAYQSRETSSPRGREKKTTKQYCTVAYSVWIYTKHYYTLCTVYSRSLCVPVFQLLSTFYAVLAFALTLCIVLYYQMLDTVSLLYYCLHWASHWNLVWSYEPYKRNTANTFCPADPLSNFYWNGQDTVD